MGTYIYIGLINSSEKKLQTNFRNPHCMQSVSDKLDNKIIFILFIIFNIFFNKYYDIAL